MKVLKFGGTSVATPDAIRQAARIVDAARREQPVAVVASALGGVTNRLLEAAELAARRDDAYRAISAGLEKRHLDAARALARPAELDELHASIDRHFVDLHDLLHGVYLLREASPRTRDGILSYGERLSSEIFAAALRALPCAARAVDTRELIVTDRGFGNAQVDLDASYPRLRAALEGDGVAVFTGFIGASPEGFTTTLGRGGSDYTAALLGAAAGAEAIELWTDVDGVMSADPRLVARAFPLPRLSYAELMELSHWGAKVVYPPSIHPARQQGIPLVIKNTFNPAAAGTRVTAATPEFEHPIRGISSIDRVSLMRLEGDGMVGVPGIAMRLFGALARRGISVILISQSSSEHSICFAIAPEDTTPAREVVDREFELERRAGMINDLVAEEDQAVIAAVGEQMRELPGLAGRVFAVLGEHGISVRAIAQGSSELNISVVVDRRHEAAAVPALHDAFFAPRRRRVALGLVGAGRVGGAFLDQLRDAAARLADREHLDLRLVAVASSRRMALDRSGLELDGWRRRLEDGDALDPGALVETLIAAGGLPILVDCTASDEPAALYAKVLCAGGGVVAANKRPFAGPLERYLALRRDAERGGGCLFHEATVGAGLPVLVTLADLARTGDRIHRVEGVLSGTVNAVLERVSDGATLSAAVRSAHAEGLTEPDPYEDLSGGDVARKLAILARLLGHELELSDVEVEPLLGPEWAGMAREKLWDALPRLDAEYETRRADAAARGRRLRYLASFDGRRARVALRALPPEHAAFAVAGPDNLIAFTTERYRDTPLVVRGPGAGPTVTAAGVFADVLRAARELGRSRP